MIEQDGRVSYKLRSSPEVVKPGVYSRRAKDDGYRRADDYLRSGRFFIRMTSNQSDPILRDPIGDPHCRRCGYNLRGLQRGGQCPECGLDILFSIRRGSLINASIPWLRRIAWGARLVLLSYVGLFLTVVFRMGWEQSMPYKIPWVSRNVPAFLFLAMTNFAGICLMTTPDESFPKTILHSTSARVTRLAAFSVLALIALWSWKFDMAPGWLGIFLLPGIGLYFGTQLYYLKNLLEHQTDEGLSEMAEGLEWLFIGAVAYQTFAVLSAGFLDADYGQPFACSALLVGLIECIAIIVYLIFLWKFSQEMKKFALTPDPR